MTVDRRTLLRALPVVAAGGAAGCGSVLGDGGLLGSSSSAGPWRWIPDTDEVEGLGETNVAAWTVHTGEFVDEVEVGNLPDYLGRRSTHLGQDPEDFDSLVPVGVTEVNTYPFTRVSRLGRLAFEVSRGSFDVDDAVERLTEDDDFADAGEEQGYRLLETDGTTVAVSEERIVEGLPDPVETVVDESPNEEFPTEAMALVADALDPGALTYAHSHEQVDETTGEGLTRLLEDQVAEGRTYRLSDDGVALQFVVVFDDEGDVDADVVEDFADELEESSGGEVDLEDVETSVNGRTASVEAVWDDEAVPAATGFAPLFRN